jgi:IclR family mhp operon transcriptional activator
MGRAYLAFSSNVVRERTLDLIAARYELGEVPLMSLSTFRQILAKTQEDGYGSNFGDWTDDKKVAAIAVPVRGERNTVVACVNVVAITRATKPQQLAAKYLEPLRAAAKRIEKAL